MMLHNRASRLAGIFSDQLYSGLLLLLDRNTASDIDVNVALVPVIATII